VARLLTAASTIVAALVVVGALAGPAQADGSSNWNHDCRATWINNADPAGEGWSTCRSTVKGGEVKLWIDRRAQVDYDGSWKGAVHQQKIDRGVCLWGCRVANVSRRGV
jgi:hypothetical protein